MLEEMAKQLKAECLPSDASKGTLKLKFIASFVFDTIYPILVTTGWFFNAIDVFEFVDSFTGALAMYQAYVKMVMLYVCRKKIVNLFDCTGEFWPADKFGKKSLKRIDIIQRKTVQIIKAYNVLLRGAVFVYLLKPLFDRKKVLPVAWYNFCPFEDNKCYFSNYILQAIYISRYVQELIRFDNVFFLFLSYSYCELEKVKYGLLHLNVRHPHVLRQIAALVRQHNRALELIEKINDLYGNLLLFQFSTTLIGLGSSFFLLTTNGISLISRYIPFIASAVVQCFIYCAIGQIIYEQTISVADTAYSSDWWKVNQPQLRKAICLIIQRGQRAVQITAGDMFAINIATFVSIMKSSLSALTFMQTCYHPE